MIDSSVLPMIDLRGLTKIYQTPVGPFSALRGIDLQIQPGEFIAVVGKSGSGKSTLINMFTGIDHPTDGEIIVAGTRVRELNEGQMAAVARADDGHRVPVFSAAAHADAGRERHAAHGSVRGSTRPASAMTALTICWSRWDWPTTRHKFPAGVSGGQQQRAAIARALANDPAIIVADEPTGNLDSRAAEAIFALFEASAAAGKTIVMVTHDDELAERAAAYGDPGRRADCR